MELERLKEDWKSITPESGNGKLLSDAKLSEITKRRVKTNTYKVIIPKLLSSIPYFFGAIFLVAFSQFFDSQLMISIAILAVTICALIPILNVFAIARYKRMVHVTSSVNETLVFVQKQGRQFIRLQYAIGLLNILLIALFVVLIPLVYSEELSPEETLVSQCVGMLVVAFFSYRVWNYYKRIIDFNVKVLKELL
ncbi:MAG: hypothetical protein AAF717_12380 [Bacteroidota bacterium]